MFSQSVSQASASLPVFCVGLGPRSGLTEHLSIFQPPNPSIVLSEPHETLVSAGCENFGQGLHAVEHSRWCKSDPLLPSKACRQLEIKADFSTPFSLQRCWAKNVCGPQVTNCVRHAFVSEVISVKIHPIFCYFSSIVTSQREKAKTFLEVMLDLLQRREKHLFYCPRSLGKKNIVWNKCPLVYRDFWNFYIGQPKKVDIRRSI